MPESENRTYAEALWDHITMDQEELPFRAGDLLEIIDMNDKDWWYGALDDHQEGWLPATFVRVRFQNFSLSFSFPLSISFLYPVLSFIHFFPLSFFSFILYFPLSFSFLNPFLYE